MSQSTTILPLKTTGSLDGMRGRARATRRSVVRQSGLSAVCSIGLALVLTLGGAPSVEARDFTLGLKAWSASLSADNLEGEEDLFFPGFYFSWGVTDRLWVSAAHLEGEFEFTTIGSAISGSVEEVNTDIIVGWSFARLDVGLGYRHTGITELKIVVADTASEMTSSGPVVYLGGGDLFGQSRWGYYWGVSYMFKDIDATDGSQEQVNGEAGFRWTSPRNLSVLLGYRYKEYFGDAFGLTFDGPTLTVAYTWR